MRSAITEQELKNLISEKLRYLRSKSKQTLEESAYFLNIDYAQYYRLLNAKCLPRLITLLKINKAYGLDMNWWFKDFLEVTSKIEAKINKNEEDAEVLNNYHRLDERAREFVRKMLKTLA
ncbi:hypothetical protein NO1_1153 [Candidatus Termititenax aidoneus]|uniref:HTH cro/C1-type domain-containing protein n=1 Tax=Termititenax aidoneus TaxID=2218524 RepID=A0A388TAV6_TERA1|nr:hypothetical protein NO1_1153 [Candidatus Termititenax aidoneus]